MDSHLAQFCDADPGFKEFVDRHSIKALSPEVLQDYKTWRYERILWADEIQRIEAKGMAKGEAKGKLKKELDIALKAFRLEKDQADRPKTLETLRNFDIPEETIQAALKQVELERDQAKIQG